MGRNTKYKPDHLCIAIFTLCLSVRFVEYFLIETDKTAIGENVLHKVVGIIILALVLKRVNLSWSDIGFQRNGFASGILKGLLLGSVCFIISYGLELAIFILQGNPAHLEMYISSFSLTGSQIKNTDFVFFLLCVLFNMINVWMEEGVFRGLFIRTLSETKPFMQANFIAAFLFGIWHMVMPIRSYINGEMSFAAMLLMGIGYMILAGIMGIKWGLLYRITGNLRAGLGDHLFNNTVAANMLHVVSLNGADELQIVRILAAQMISFAVVLAIHTDRTTNVRSGITARTEAEIDNGKEVEGQRRKGLLNDLKELVKLMKEHPIIIVVTLAAMVVGAILGAAAFYQGWLG